MMRARQPFLVNRGMAPRGTARFRIDKQVRRNHLPGIRTSIRRDKIPSRDNPRPPRNANESRTGDKNNRPEDQGSRQLSIALFRELASHETLSNVENAHCAEGNARNEMEVVHP